MYCQWITANQRRPSSIVRDRAICCIPGGSVVIWKRDCAFIIMHTFQQTTTTWLSFGLGHGLCRAQNLSRENWCLSHYQRDAISERVHYHSAASSVSSWVRLYRFDDDWEKSFFSAPVVRSLSRRGCTLGDTIERKIISHFNLRRHSTPHRSFCGHFSSISERFMICHHVCIVEEPGIASVCKKKSCSIIFKKLNLMWFDFIDAVYQIVD